MLSTSIFSFCAMLSGASDTLFLSASALLIGILRTHARSFVMWSPPTGMTDSRLGLPSEKTATPVVPPPRSTTATPAMASSLDRHPSELARGFMTRPETASPAFPTQLTTFWMTALGTMIDCSSTSSLTPVMSRGSSIPECPSRVYSTGIV